VDDFGAGYSSLSYLKNFPIDRIKIDRSFVKDISNNPSDRAIVEVIIAMAGKLGLDLVAEGVETLDQLEFLKSRGCNDIQGYYFHRPLPEAQFVELLKQGAVRSASSLQPAIGL
jgi:EAL domain-containing protein (putative c-di-GMP-specific phosphodiesterase class I)